MLNNDMSRSMKTEVEKLAKAVTNKSHVYNITFLFTSEHQTDLKVRLSREIDSLIIDQDFISNYTDKIMAELTLDRDPYVTLYYSRKDLFCEVTFSETEPTLRDEGAGCSVRKAIKEYKLKFRAVITKYEDIFRKVDVDRIWPDFHEKRNEVDEDRATYKMSVELISKDVFLARKERINEVFNDITIKDAIIYASNYFGFKKMMLVDPHNTWKYTSFVIPPSYGVDKIMGFFQNSPGLGVYNDGFVSYITRWWKDLQSNSWYIYPRFGSPVKENPIHVYSVGSNIYYGLNQNHYLDGNITKILVNEELNIKNWSDVNTENEITAANVLISEDTLDATRTLIADDLCKGRKATSNYISLSSDPMDMKHVVNLQHMRSYGNEYAIRSRLRIFQGTSVQFKWRNAHPWTFTPGTEVQIHYDHPLGFRTWKGMPERATYRIVRDTTKAINPQFICNAEITLNCDNIPDKKKAKES